MVNIAKDIPAKLQGSLLIALVMTGVVYLVGLLMSFLHLGTNALFTISATTPFTSTIGNKIIGLLSGVGVTFDIASLFPIYLSTLAIFFVGGLLMDWLRLPAGRKDWERTALTILYGSIPFYFLLVGVLMPGVNALLGYAIYIAAVSIVAGYVAELVGWKI